MSDNPVEITQFVSNVNLYFSFLEQILYKKFHSPYWITIHNTNMVGRRTILFVPNLVTRMVKG